MGEVGRERARPLAIRGIQQTRRCTGRDGRRVSPGQSDLHSGPVLFNDSEKLASALSELDDEWRSGFLHHGKVVNPNFVRTSFDGLILFTRHINVLPDL